MDELEKIGHEDNPWKLGNNWAQENVTNWGNGTMDGLEETEQSKDIGQHMNSQISMD
jgi:hypothetical protein